MPAVDIFVVMPSHQTNLGLGLKSGDRIRPLVDDLTAERGAGFVLLLLIALHRVDKKMREIVPQSEPRANGISAGRDLPVVATDVIVAGQAEPFGETAIRGIERAEPADQSFLI